MTKLGALVQQLGPNKWLIAAGEQVPEFVFANGPAFVTHYNFNQTRGRKVDLKYLAINSHHQVASPRCRTYLCSHLQVSSYRNVIHTRSSTSGSLRAPENRDTR